MVEAIEIVFWFVVVLIVVITVVSEGVFRSR